MNGSDALLGNLTRSQLRIECLPRLGEFVELGDTNVGFLDFVGGARELLVLGLVLIEGGTELLLVLFQGGNLVIDIL